MANSSSGDLLFGRRARITIGTLQVASEGSEGLRIALSVNRSLTVESNRASVSIYNLSQDKRIRLEGEQDRFVIEAGYEKTMETIFSGKKANVISQKLGVDAVTNIEASDGRSELDKRVNISFKSGVTAKTVMNQLKQLGGSFLGVIKGDQTLDQALNSTIFKNGYSFQGKLGESAQEVSEAAKLELSVQNGEILLLSKKGVSSNTAIVLSSGSGMLGAPVRVIDPKRPKIKIVRVSSLMNPAFAPGIKVQLQGTDHDGDYKVIKSSFVGDTHGGDGAWVTNIEMVSL